MSLSNSQSNFSSKNLTKQNTLNSQNSYNKINNKDNPLIKIRKLYPSLSEDFVYEENNATIKNDSEFLRNRPSFLSEEKINTILSEEFLQNIIKRPCPLNKSKIIPIMSKFIQNTSLIQKIQKELQSDKNKNINELSIMCAEILNYIELKKGKVLFRIGDIGDRFYFILSGKICVLKLREIQNIQMYYEQYIDYCMFLIKKKEFYIFNEVIKKNYDVLRITREAEVRAIFKILMLKKLKERIIQQLVHDIKSLKSFLEEIGCRAEELDIHIEELEPIEKNNLLKNKEREFSNYLFKKCKPSFQDLILYEPFESKFENEEKNSITCYCYESFLFLGKGLFFGDFALDSEINKRNATIRAEEDTILAYLKSVDYINIFAPKRKLEKMKEISFLYYNYFFNNINSRVFEKNYFHLFSPREYNRKTVLFIFGSNPKGVYFLKEGKVSLELNSSIIDLHNLIKFLWENIYLSKWYKMLSNYQKKELIPSIIEKEIKEYINEPIFITLKVYGEEFINEINKINKYTITMLTYKEIIGLEEVYLNIPYIMKGIVIDNKVKCYEISIENINKFILEEKQILFPFVKSAVNKIISLIKRLQNIKKNGINMLKSKFEKDYIDFMNVHEEKNSNNENNLNQINEVNSKKEKESIKYINNNKIIYNKETKILKNKIENKRYKSPVRLISTNLAPAISLISANQTLINKYENLSLDKVKRSSISKDYINIEYNDNYYLKEIEKRNDDNIIDNNNKNNISRSTSTDAMASSENNESILKINNNKTIIELKKELKKINVIEFENNEIMNLNNNEKNTKRSFSYNHLLNNKFSKIQNIKKNLLLKRLGNFHLSYVPLNILSPKGRLFQRSNSSINIIKNGLSKPNSNNKRIFNYINIYSQRNSRKDLEEAKKNNYEKEGNINNIMFGQKQDKIKKIEDININNKFSRNIIKNNQNIFENYSLNNEELKKKLSLDVIKNFYEEIKKRGYSSFIHNKESNTIFNRKYKRKYGTNSSQKILTPQNENKKNSLFLPIIKKKIPDSLDDKGS